ncbi:MAG: hypothetical protein ACPGDB_02325, partial [Fusobacterium sp.]
MTCEDGNVGIRVKSRKETSLHDSIDSKQMVKNLCASQRFLPMHFFLTFTVNQLEHFGVKMIKKWVDGKDWNLFFKNKTNLTEYEFKNLQKSMDQASCPILLRNWMETRTFLIDFIYGSEKSPYYPVNAIFSRDEYQKDKGNLPHIHLILSIDMKQISEEKKSKLNDLIRASVCSIRSYEEIQELIDEGLINSWDDIHEIQDLAKKILSHKCDKRCLRRVGDGEGPENFKCRKLNNSKLSKDNTKDTYISIESKRSKECMDQLIKIGLAEPMEKNQFGVSTDFKAYHKYFHPKRHIPPTNPNYEVYNISPVEGYTFCVLRSMQNIQSLTHTNGLNRYVCKYIGKIDEQNQIIIKSNPSDKGNLISNGTFLHNTKITSSELNEKRAFEKKRERFHPKGRSISITEMLQIMLSYPQVRTDMEFTIIGTVPLEQRVGVEINPIIRSTSEKQHTDKSEEQDGVNTSFPCYEIRKDLNLPDWRQLRDSELLTLEGTVVNSKVSVDKVTQFSLRPPELREIVTKVGLYYRWFFIDNVKIHESRLDMFIKKNL